MAVTVLDLRECVLMWESASAAETERLGAVLGRLLRPGDVIALLGDLGSGKTVLVRGLASGLGCAADEVHSPSFTLINEYAAGRGGWEAAGGDRPPRLAHVDLYRIRSEDELPGIGWDAYVNSRYVAAVEWADRALRWLPRDHLRVSLETLEGDRRRFRVQATGPRSHQVVLDWVDAAGIRAEAS